MVVNFSQYDAHQITAICWHLNTTNTVDVACSPRHFYSDESEHKSNPKHSRDVMVVSFFECLSPVTSDNFHIPICGSCVCVSFTFYSAFITALLLQLLLAICLEKFLMLLQTVGLLLLGLDGKRRQWHDNDGKLEKKMERDEKIQLVDESAKS